MNSFWTVVIILGFGALSFRVLKWLLFSRLPVSVPMNGTAEAADQYQQKRNYFDSLVYHVAVEEGSVSEQRILELIPDLATCAACYNHLRLVFELGLEKKELLKDPRTGVITLSLHTYRCVCAADHCRDVGDAWVLARDKIRFTHHACHNPPVP